MDLQALKAPWGKPPTEPEEMTTDPHGVGDEMGRSKISLYDLPNETVASVHPFGLTSKVLLKALSHIATADLLPIALTSTRLHDLARRVLRGNLISAIGLSDLRVILESYHPSAQWTEPYLYCMYLGTPGLGMTSSFGESFSRAENDHPHHREESGSQSRLPLTTSDELIYCDPRAPPCGPRSMALLMRNVYSRFRPLVPNAMTITETRHPAGGFMPVRTGNIQRASSLSAPGGYDTNGHDASSASLSSSAPTATTLGQENQRASSSAANAAAIRNAMLLTDRLRTTNPNAGPASHAFAEGALLRAQIKQAEAVEATRQGRAPGNPQEYRSGTASSTSPTSMGESPPSSTLSRSTTRSSNYTASTSLTTPESSCAPMLEELPLVSHMIRLDWDESFSQLVVQTSLVGSESRKGVFGQLLPVNTGGIVRVWRYWLSERAEAEAEGRVDEWEEKRHRTLWVDNAHNVGLRVRVQKVERPPSQGETRGDHREEWRLQYEELLIRAAHLENIFKRHHAGELGHRATQAIIFGSFFERYYNDEG